MGSATPELAASVRDVVAKIADWHAANTTSSKPSAGLGSSSGSIFATAGPGSGSGSGSGNGSGGGGGSGGGSGGSTGSGSGSSCLPEIADVDMIALADQLGAPVELARRAFAEHAAHVAAGSSNSNLQGQ